MKTIYKTITDSFIFNALLFLFSSFGLAVLSLLQAIGNGQLNMFYDYFRYPMTFFLNALPIILLQGFLLCISGRQWIAFLISGIIVLAASAGDYFKLIIRYEPFLFSDIHYIGAALGVSKDYSLSLNSRLITSLIALLAGSFLLAVFAKRTLHLKSRFFILIFILLSIFPLWRYVYSSDDVYNSSLIVQRDYDREMYKTASKGFVYPFIYSIKDVHKTPPEGYNEKKVAAFLSSYADSKIPEDKRINIIAIQLEAFSDLRALGISGISQKTYEYYDQLKAESISGTLMVNVNGGATIDTEQCFLTGDYRYYKVNNTTPSFVWYMKDQGYRTVGGHPYYSFYGRQISNPLLGFETYRFCENYDGYPDIELLSPSRNYSDCFFFDSIFEQYMEIVNKGENVFSFNVTMQGHGPYSTDEYLFGDIWFDGSNCSAITSHILNNYLGGLADTQKNLSKLIDALRDEEHPVVVVLYGDHKPWLGDNSSIVDELAIPYDTTSENGIINYYSTEYIIWANNRTKELYPGVFAEKGPTISTCYLLPYVFQKLEWNSCGYSNYLIERMNTLNVITSKNIFFEHGSFTEKLSPEGEEMLELAENILYYRQFLSQKHQK